MLPRVRIRVVLGFVTSSFIISYILYRWHKRRKHDKLCTSGDVQRVDRITEPAGGDGPAPGSRGHADDLHDGPGCHGDVGQLGEMTDDLSQLDGGQLTLEQSQMLVALLASSTDNDVLQRALRTVQNAAAFTTNQESLREAGALPRLSSLLSAHRMALRVGQSITYPAIINGVISSINNMAMNQRNQKHLKECIPALIDFASTDKADESIQLASLQALTNLSVNSDYHTPYTKLIQQLYEYLDCGTHTIQMQALKVLANLSTNHSMVPHLLAAKAPNCLLDLLMPDTHQDLLIRWTSVLANVILIVKEQGITASSLPLEYKAPSPETTYTALYGHVNSHKLKSKIYVLCRHSNVDIRHQASRIHGCLT